MTIQIALQDNYILPITLKPICLDLGAGHSSVHLDSYHVLSVDARVDYHPDILCDLRKIPLSDESVSAIYSSHTLEHFCFSEIHDVFTEWLRILKIGGDITLRLPDITYAAKLIMNGQYDNIAQAVLWGQQDYPLNFHKMGFTPKFLASFLKQFPVTGKITTPIEYVHDILFSGAKTNG